MDAPHLLRSALRQVCALLAVASSAFAASPEVTAMLEQPRSHPYLFFSATDLPKLRERAKRAPWSDAAAVVTKTADLCLAAEIPAEPPPGPDSPYDQTGA